MVKLIKDFFIYLLLFLLISQYTLIDRPIQFSNASEVAPYNKKLGIDWDPSSILLVVSAITEVDGKHNLEIWDISSKSITKKITNYMDYDLVSWSNEGDKIATVIHKSLLIYSTKDWLIQVNETKHNKTIDSIAWSPDDTKIATTSHGEAIIIWNVTDGSVIDQLDGKSYGGKSASWNYDNTIFASTGKIYPEGFNHSQVNYITAGEEYESEIKETIKLWDSRNGTLIGHLDGHSRLVNSIAWHYDQNILASASFDSTVKIWNVTEGVVIQSLSEHKINVYQVVWRPDSEMIVSLARGHDYPSSQKIVNEIKIWKLGTDTSIKTLNFDKSPYYMAISPDGKYLAYTLENGIYLYDFDTSKTITIFKGEVRSAEGLNIFSEFGLPLEIYLPLSSIIILVIYRKKVFSK